jgi:hypothetical protein
MVMRTPEPVCHVGSEQRRRIGGCRCSSDRPAPAGVASEFHGRSRRAATDAREADSRRALERQRSEASNTRQQRIDSRET